MSKATRIIVALLILATLIGGVAAFFWLRQDKPPSVSDVFIEHQLEPDIVRRAPRQLLGVHFPLSGVSAQLGNTLTPAAVRQEPRISWPSNSDSAALYTLCFTDADGPSRDNTTNREFHHWLVVNVPYDGVSRGKVLTAFVGSGPPATSGPHRYAFLLFRQPNGQAISTDDEPILHNNSAQGRAYFRVQAFADKYSLGDALAGNFYYAAWDESVPALERQLGLGGAE